MAAGTTAAALGTIRTADAFDTFLLCFVNIARCTPKDQSQDSKNYNIFHIVTPC